MHGRLVWYIQVAGAVAGRWVRVGWHISAVLALPLRRVGGLNGSEHDVADARRVPTVVLGGSSNRNTTLDSEKEPVVRFAQSVTIHDVVAARVDDADLTLVIPPILEMQLVAPILAAAERLR